MFYNQWQSELAQEDYDTIEKWNFFSDTAQEDFLHRLNSMWNDAMGRLCIDRRDKSGTKVTLITGGWSYNEGIITAMEANVVIKTMFWESSHRGGKHIYIFRKFGA